ncbi:hypothetical protein, partial [Yersinia enterocolitica]|uniref:hypothetical protein n=1 Tax=Yersinia enterocolitica TaxID=630 RepID=UPI0019CFD757
HYPWRGRFTLLPILTLQVRVGEVCHSETHPAHFAVNQLCHISQSHWCYSKAASEQVPVS